MKIVINKYIQQYIANLKAKQEIRIDYVAMITEDIVIPLYYYTQKQKNGYASIDCTMQLDTIRAIDMDIVQENISVLESMGHKAIAIELTGNLHTHPVGIKSWSQTDYNGCMKPDYADGMLGSNILFGFDGEYYASVIRRRESEDEYLYSDIDEAVYLDDFEPYINIDENNFNFSSAVI